MAEKTRYHCPNCSYLIRGDLRKVSAVTCRNCHQQYSVLYDEDDGKIALVEIVTARTVEPLNLPKGSIRAVTTMATSVAAWFFVFAGKDIPEFLASLMLAILGYYFGFRTKVKGAETRIHDATIEKLEPLYLPEGFIRGFLVFGFAAAAITLYVTGRLTHTGHLGFFIVLAGLIVGYVFAKAVAGIRGDTRLQLPPAHKRRPRHRLHRRNDCSPHVGFVGDPPHGHLYPLDGDQLLLRIKIMTDRA